MNNAPAKPSAAKSKAWSTLLALIAFATMAALAVSFTEKSTHDRISANRIAHSMKIVAEVLPADSYDNQPHLDSIQLSAPDWLGSNDALPAYRARLNGKPVATALTVVAPDGYVGDIRLLVGINIQGQITAVRVLEHHETPGLGDKIDSYKSDWIHMFAGEQLGAHSDATRWALERDGGRFDHITGATITSRAVVNAIRRSMKLYELNPERIAEVTAGSGLILTTP